MYQQYYPNYSFMQQMPQMQQQMPPQYMQPQKEERFGIISVNGEKQARDWPLAPGSSLTFKDETGPYIYTKTMGLSQFDAPIFEKYRLIKEADLNDLQENQKIDTTAFDSLNKEAQETKETIGVLENEINNIHGEFNTIHGELDGIQKSYDSLKEELDDIRQWMRQPFANNKNDRNKNKGD